MHWEFLNKQTNLSRAHTISHVTPQIKIHTQKKKKNQKIIKILELQGFNYVTVWVNCLWKRS